MSQHYVDPKTARQSYRPRNLMSPGLQRAREPFRLRNALTGILLAGFAVGVWAYSIGAVKQDVFDDVDEEARALMAGSGLQKAEDVPTENKPLAVEPTQSTTSPTPAAPEARPETKLTTGRGILPPLLERRFPSVLDPSSRTLVWGAPSVDNVGKLGDRTSGGKRLV